MGDSIRLAECFNMTVRDAYELPKKRAVLVRNWYEFQDYLWERVAEPLIAYKVMKRNTFSIGASDGIEYAHWMKNAGLEDTSIPNCFLIDFVGEGESSDT